MVVTTVWYAVREIVRAEAAMEVEYERSEALLANILPASIADRLKDPERNIIADKYDDASVLFADIAGFTERASDMRTGSADPLPGPALQRLRRAGRQARPGEDQGQRRLLHGGQRRASTASRSRRGAGSPCARHGRSRKPLKDSHGDALPLRIGLASGPVVAGVVGSRRFFYDVWGDAVNVASRMETTDSIGRIQVPEDVYRRLKDDFVLQERGDVEVKGKGVDAHLVSHRTQARHRIRRRSSRGALRQSAPDGPANLPPRRRFVGKFTAWKPLLFQSCCRICGSRPCSPGSLSLTLGILVYV